MAFGLAFVDSVAASPTTRLDLNADPWTTLAEGTDWGYPELEYAVVSTLLADGEQIPAAAYTNRILTLQLRLNTATTDTALTQLQALHRELDRPRNILRYTLGTTPVFFHTFRASPNQVTVHTDGTLQTVEVDMPAEPFAVGLKETPVSAVTLDTDPAAATNPTFIDVTGVIGDVETPAVVTWPGAAVLDGRQTLFTARRRGTPEAVTTPIRDDFQRSVTDGWGTATSGESWSTSGGAAADYDVDGSEGTVSGEDVTNRRFTTVGSLTDVELLGSITVPVTATGEHIYVGLIARFADTNNFYLFQLGHDTTGNIDLEIVKRVAGTFTSLASSQNQLAYTAGSPTHVRARVVGDTLQLRIWNDSTLEAVTWDVQVTDTDITAAGAVGTHTKLGDANTNTLPVVVSFDNFSARAPTNIPYLLQAEDLMQGTDTTIQANSANFSGEARNHSRCDFATDATLNVARLQLSHLLAANPDLRGRYRVLARYQKSTTADGDMAMQLQWGSAAWGATTNDAFSCGPSSDILFADLGDLTIPRGHDPITDGRTGTELDIADQYFIRVDIERTSGTGTIDIDYLLLVPADDRLALVEWGDEDPDNWVLDAATDQVHGRTTAGQVISASPPALDGVLPMLTPDQTNRLYMLYEVSGAFANALTTVTPVTVAYWPRYLQVRPPTT